VDMEPPRGREIGIARGSWCNAGDFRMMRNPMIADC
jgi:hypothetical protein